MRDRLPASLALPLAFALAATGCAEGDPAASSVASAALPAGPQAAVGAPRPGVPDSALAPRLMLDLSGPGWSLWLDQEASWEQDEIFAPPVDVAALPVNTPTGGWAALASADLKAPAPAGQTAPSAAAGVFAASVPGTVEQFTWAALLADRGGDPPGADAAGDYLGVSWWWREFEVPAAMLQPVGGASRALQLHFDAARQRAEVFLNERLVGYDVVGNTPFRVDCGDALRPGRNVLAVRITDPGGNFSWEDFDALRWGSHTLPTGHGFGGVTGSVRLVSTSAVRLDDLAVLNRPDPRAIEIIARVLNPTSETLAAALHVELLDAVTREPLGVTARRIAEPCPPGRSEIRLSLTVPGAPLWSPESPRLFTCRVALTTAIGMRFTSVSDSDGLRITDDVGPPQDVLERRFGFRWFDLDGIGTDAVLRLNGERIVLRSAISWGFWPGSGMVPGPGLGRAQVLAAQALGLNMLNHHRGIAAPGLLDLHDELGLLAYEEPGGYAARGGDDLCSRLAREKLLRMVERDRSHPSLIIVNLINEEITPPTDAQRRDLADAHALDPTRLITFTSGWAVEGPDPLKLHARPRDPADARAAATAADISPDSTASEAAAAALPDGLYETGWWDHHNAPGPGVWRDEFWKGPGEFRRRTELRDEVVFWGEDGAIAAPPRLGSIRAVLGATGASAAQLGWDGADYLAWADAHDAWLQRHGFRAAFPTLDALTDSLGDIAQEYQARSIANLRLDDVTDGYVINGWEDTKLENHSGVVDVFRHIKGNAAIIAAANEPLALVVNLRQSVVAAGERIGGTARASVAVQADVGLLNELDLSGPHALSLELRDSAGRVVWQQRGDTYLAGGERFGQMLAEGFSVGAVLEPGEHTLVAELRAAGAGPGAAPLLAGRDTLLVVDWKSRGMSGNGAYFEAGRALRRFFEGAGWPLPEVFHSGLPPLDWVALGDFDPVPREAIPPEAFTHETFIDDGAGAVYATRPGLQAAFVKAGTTWDGTQPLTVAEVGGEWSRQEPAPGLGLTDYTATYSGLLTVPKPGRYLLHTLSDDGVRLWIDGNLVVDHWESHAPTVDSSGPLDLGNPAGHAFRLEYRQVSGEAVLKLFWTTPGRQEFTARVLDELLPRARDHGTSLLFLHHADRWAPLLSERGVLASDGLLEHGRYWLGGGFFAREHELLAGLPANTALGRPWQALVNYDLRRYGLHLRAADGAGDGAAGAPEVIIGCVTGHEFEPAAALAILPYGKGRILLNTLNIVNTLNGPPGPADSVRTLLQNILHWGR